MVAFIVTNATTSKTTLDFFVYFTLHFGNTENLNYFYHILAIPVEYSNTRPKRLSIDNTNKNRRLLGAGGSQRTTAVQAEPITIAY